MGPGVIRIRLTRKEGWEQRLHALIEARRDTPFAWGENDCLMFAADCIFTMTGVDPTTEWRGYSDEAEAKRRLTEYCGSANLIAAAYKYLGRPTTHVRNARRGDLVAYARRDWPMFGVVTLNGTHFATPSATGLAFYDLDNASLAWRIG